MASKTKIRAFVVSLAPPILYPLLRKFINSSFVFSLNKRLGVNFYAPKWNTIKKGTYKGINLYFDASKGIWEQEMIDGTYDRYFFDYVEKCKVKGKIFFDVGAHIGFSTLCFSRLVGPKGKVIAFEPNVYNFERLQMNIEGNPDLQKNISLESFALSDKNGKQKFLFTNNIEDWTSSGSFLSSAHTLLEKESYETEFGFDHTIVTTRTIDKYVETKKVSPDFIKIDVEGAEIFVLEGAKELLKKKKPMLFIELHSIFNGFKVTELLMQLKYKITLLYEEKDGRCFIVAV